MAHLTTFEKKLNKLFSDKTYHLKARLGLKKRGQPPKMTRAKITKAIGELQDVSSTILAKGLAKKEFDKNSHGGKGRKIKGHGWKKQKAIFEEWFDGAFINQDHLIYVFWNKKKCVYVGRTGKGGSRPSKHFSHTDFRAITRIDIYPAKSKSQLPKLECLAVHHFEPSVNNYKPSIISRTKKCPLCEVHKQIEKDLRSIFSLKKRTRAK